MNSNKRTKGEEIDNYAQVLSSDRQYVSRKSGRGFTRIKDCVAATIRGRGKCTKKSKERLITVKKRTAMAT